MLNYYFKDTISSFLQKSTEDIIGTITLASQFDSTLFQNRSWEQQIPILKKAINGHQGSIFFEFSIPRMGRRVDSIIIIDDVVFVVEFKVGENKFLQYQVEQVWDYALDLKNFHKPSHTAILVPILVSTEARTSFLEIGTTSHNDNLLLPIRSNKDDLALAIRNTLDPTRGRGQERVGDRHARGREAASVGGHAPRAHQGRARSQDPRRHPHQGRRARPDQAGGGVHRRRHPAHRQRRRGVRARARRSVQAQPPGVDGGARGLLGAQ